MRIEVLDSAGAGAIPQPGCSCSVCVEAKARASHDVLCAIAERVAADEGLAVEYAHDTMAVDV